MVSITLRVLSRPDVEHLSRIYQSLGMDYDERVLPSIGNEVLKSIVAQFDAAELITQREVVSRVIRLVHSSIDIVIRFLLVFVPTFCNALESSTSNSRTSLSPTLRSARFVLNGLADILWD
jgi:hypothetical protein